MGKILKVLLSIIAGLFLIIVIAAVALPFFISPNDFKPQIETAVKDKTGRKLIIPGDLKLSVFPWLGLSTGEIILNNPAGFEDQAFAKIEKSAIKVKLIPLLSKKIEVDRIILEGLSLNLTRNKQGITNWDDLIPSAAEEEEEEEEENNIPTAAHEESLQTAPKPINTLAIAGVTLKNASIDWNDQKAGTHIVIKPLNLDTNNLAFSKPVDISLDFILENPKTKLIESVKLTTVVNIDEKFERFTLSDIDLSSQTQTESIPAGALDTHINAEAALDLNSQQLKISNLKARSGDLKISADISGTAIKDNPVFKGPISVAQFNLVQVLKQWNVDLPPMRDSKALSQLSVDFNLQATPTFADLQDIIIQLDGSTIKGNTQIDNFSLPAIMFALTIDSLDLDRYLPPESQQKSSSKAIASPAAAVAAGASLFPVDTLKELDINGLLSVDKMKVNNLSMQGVNLKLSAKNGVIDTEQAIKHLYQGSYAGSFNLDVRNREPILTLNEKLTNVRIEPLLTDLKGENARITGSINASARLKGTGNNPEALKSTLNGQLNFIFKDGVVKGINLQQIIDDAKSLIKGQPLVTDNPNDQTVFSEIKGTADVINGLVVNEDLIANSSKLRVTGEGSADLKTEQLDYKLIARLIKDKATETEPEKFSKMPILINLQGTFDKPEFTLDIAAMLIEKNKEKIEQKKEELLEKLDKKLEKKLGPGGASDLLKRFF